MQVLRVGDRVGEQCVAVGRGARGIGSAHDAGAAGLVLDHDVLPDPLLHHGRQKADRNVGQPAGRERHHNSDGPRRIVLRLCSRR